MNKTSNICNKANTTGKSQGGFIFQLPFLVSRSLLLFIEKYGGKLKSIQIAPSHPKSEYGSQVIKPKSK